MLEQNEATAHRFYETTGIGDLSIIDKLLSKDVVIYDSAGGHHGRGNIRRVMVGHGATFAGWHVTVNDQIAEGDRVVSCLTFGGNHIGAMMGTEPTGKVVDSTQCSSTGWYGIIVEGWHSPNYYSLFRQLGAYLE